MPEVDAHTDEESLDSRVLSTNLASHNGRAL